MNITNAKRILEIVERYVDADRGKLATDAGGLVRLPLTSSHELLPNDEQELKQLGAFFDDVADCWSFYT